MGKGSIRNKLNLYIDLILKEFNPKYIILYGSHANGTANHNSDIDIAIIVDKIEGNPINESAKLWLMTAEIDTAIEPVLTEDCTDDEDISGFVNNIKRNGQILYKRAA